MKLKYFLFSAFLALSVSACQSSGDSAKQSEGDELAPVPLTEKKQSNKLVKPQRDEAKRPAPEPRQPQGKDRIDWMGLSEAMTAQKEAPKPIFIDVYTDWCGWCKVMDKKTFSQKKVASYMNENFYPVKFNAEKAPPITLGGREYKLMPAGRKQVHTLAYALLDGNLGYPAYVVLDENLQRSGFFKGYKDAPSFLSEVKQLQ